MIIDVVIPLVNPELGEVVIRNLENGSVRPNTIFIVDNTPTRDFYYLSDRVDLVIVQSDNGWTNESWQLGLDLTNADALSILNDDLVLNENFLKKVREGLKDKKCGVICPRTFADQQSGWQEEMKRTEKLPSSFERMKKREGWAFTIKRECFSKIPPIPKDLKLFFGDDWYWRWVHKIGYFWHKDVNNVIYHAVGSSMRKGEEALRKFRRIREEERKIFREEWSKCV